MVSRDDEHIICPPRALIAVAISASDIDRVVYGNDGHVSYGFMDECARTLKAILSTKWLTPALDGVSNRAPASM
jgi:hypothetical protein